MIARPAGVCSNVGSGFGWPWFWSSREALVCSGIGVIVSKDLGVGLPILRLLKSNMQTTSFPAATTEVAPATEAPAAEVAPTAETAPAAEAAPAH